MTPAFPARSTWGFDGLFEMINVHPLFVHFPVALFTVCLVFYAAGAALKRESLLAAGKWTLLAGTVGAALSVWTGLKAEDTVPHAGGVHALMETHEMLGFIVLGLGALLSFWVLLSRSPFPRRGRALFLLILFALNLALIQGAEMGGRMVYLNGVGVGRKSMAVNAKAQEATDPHEHTEHAHS